MLHPYFEVAFVLQLKNISETVTRKETANIGNGGGGGLGKKVMPPAFF
jgi:hypothetical protein